MITFSKRRHGLVKMDRELFPCAAMSPTAVESSRQRSSTSRTLSGQGLWGEMSKKCRILRLALRGSRRPHARFCVHRENSSCETGKNEEDEKDDPNGNEGWICETDVCYKV
ncbi:hypothetical protein TorRG33x02_273410 [Trema orientale]|uniref:Uncharacterized protein n=1 Tax=Trema orientale TaxID=63057 RepID=A0A2P5CTE8_TREOI|nr:hypothetical protein TorRG33x02_273410 [Trema orientale]